MIDTKIFEQFDKVALAVSGGKDSMALLYDFARLFPHNFFYVINIEHGIRGKESIEDSEFVCDYASSLGVKVVRYDVDAIKYSKDNGYTLEQGARLLRREIFTREVQEKRADRVVVAHHMDDNVESILMHIFRGSGLRGIKGMDIDDGVLLRPMLSVSRAYIDEFIKTNNIPYREDSTNSDTAYRRNFIRSEIMPLLRKIYTGIDNNICRLSESAREDEKFLSDMARAYISCDGDRIIVEGSAPMPLFKRAIYQAFMALDVTHDVEERHYSLLSDLLDKDNGTTLDMPYGIKATLEYGKIALYHDKDIKYSSTDLKIGENIVGEFVVRVDRADKVELEKADGIMNRTLFVDGAKLDNCIIRSRQSGDMFTKFGGSRKKLKDYFIDIKLPKLKRDIPVVARDNEILVVPGIEISDSVKVNVNTKEIFKIQVRRISNGLEQK